MKTKTVLVVTNNPLLANTFIQACRSFPVDVIGCDDVTALERFDEIQPALICVDASIDSDAKPSLKRYLDVDLRLKSTPIVFILSDPALLTTLRFAPDICVYCLVKGPRLLQAWKAVLEELLDITPVEAEAPVLVNTNR